MDMFLFGLLNRKTCQYMYTYIYESPQTKILYVVKQAHY